VAQLPSDERDQTQRSLGFIGLSAFAHMGLLIAVLLAPGFKSAVGSADGKQAGLEFTGEQLANASPAPGAPSKDAPAPGNSAPTEVLLADANDPNAVALPASTKAAEPAPAVKPAEKLAEKPAEKIALKPAAKPIVKAAKKPKVEAADISDALQAARTESSKSKVAKAAAPKVKSALIETAEASDVAAPAEVPAEATTEEAVQLQVALPEKEALTEKEAEELQAPNASAATATEEAPATEAAAATTATESESSSAAEAAKPAEVAQPTQAPARQQLAQNAQPAQATGLIVTRPATGATTAIPNRSATLAGTPGGSGTNVRPIGAGGTSSGTSRSASAGGGTLIGIPYGATVRDARSLIATDKPQATYPLQDRISRHEGTAVLVGHVTNDGRVERITLEKSSGSRLMDESAAKAFSKWKFRPGQEGYIRLPIQFQLAGSETIIPAQLNRQ